MTIPQFFIRQSQIDSHKLVTIVGDDARHGRIVLRLKKGSAIRLVDENQNRYTAEVERVTEDGVVARISRSAPSPGPKKADVMVVQGIPRLPKADLVTQKLTELGVSKIVFVPMRFSSYGNAYERMHNRLDRLRRIAEAAAKQCGRSDIPEIMLYPELEGAAKELAQHTKLLVADEKGRGESLHHLLRDCSEKPSVAVIVGPEGGLSPEEAKLLVDAGVPAFSLGRTILRTETAAIVAAALVLYELGEI